MGVPLGDPLTAYHFPILAMGIFLLLYYFEGCPWHFQMRKRALSTAHWALPASQSSGSEGWITGRGEMSAWISIFFAEALKDVGGQASQQKKLPTENRSSFDFASQLVCLLAS
jgi:hypothetical protein